MKLSTFAAILGALATLAASAASAAIVSTTNLTVLPAGPATVGRHFIINSGGVLPSQLAFDEQQDYFVTQAVTTDTGTIPAYTWVNSAFFALESATPVPKQTTSITFDGPILGVVYLSGSANYASSDFLGYGGTTYSESARNCHCGFDQGDGYFINGNTITFTNHYKVAGDFARIITAANTCTARVGPATTHQRGGSCCGSSSPSSATHGGSHPLNRAC